MIPAATTPEAKAPSDSKVGGLSMTRLRALIIVVLCVSVGAFTVGVSALVQRIFDDFGPAVRQDIEWKTLRGAKELAAQAEVAIAIGDKDLVAKTFVDYRSSADLVAILVTDKDGHPIVIEGKLPESPGKIFAAPQDKLRSTANYFVAWSAASIEGTPVGRVAVMMSTGRIINAQKFLRQIRIATIIAGLLVLVGGIVFVSFAVRAIVLRDKQLAEYAAGLERKVAERTAALDERNRGMRLVLDHVAQGLVTIDLQGVLSPERSSIIDEWLGAPPPGSTFMQMVCTVDPHAADGFALGLDQLRDAMLPLELLIEQMPNRLRVGERTMRLAYTPICDGEIVLRLLVVMTDITAELARERIDRDQRELVSIFQRLFADRNGFLDFVDECSRLTAQLVEETLVINDERRILHTLKGGAGLFGLETLAELCHEVEQHLTDEQMPIPREDREIIATEWTKVEARIQSLAGHGDGRSITLTGEEYEDLLDRLSRGAPHAEIARLAAGYRLDSIETRLARFGEQATTLAKRLGKAPLEIELDGGGVRLDGKRWKEFWGVFPHVVRNAVDHGVEDVARRAAAGKTEVAHLTLSARAAHSNLVIAIRDDGAGVDWQRVADKARACGLPSETSDDLVAAIFSDGISTRDQASAVSGRGIGLAAVKDVVTKMGGEIRVVSEPGLGTTFEFTFPQPHAPA